MKNLKLISQWKRKLKQAPAKTKPVRFFEDITEYVKDEDWHMSPEDALRVAYSGHK